jgi:hypothetical protein
VIATYIALIGAIALASALAFGLGGREAAADLVNSGYRKAQEQTDTVQSDARLARERGERAAQHAHTGTEDRASQRVAESARGGGRDSGGLVP